MLLQPLSGMCVWLGDVSQTLGSLDSLTLTAANGTDMPYLGWTEMTFQFSSETNPAEELLIPVLVMKGCRLSHPIIGFDIIERILENTGKTKLYRTISPASKGIR